MNQLDAISSLHADDREAKRLDSKKPRVWVPKRENLRARVFEMPLLPLGHDNGEVHYAMVIPASTSSLWLRDTDVPWLVASVADEVAHGGIAVDGDHDAAVAAVGPPNCKVPDLRIDWDWDHGNAWKGIFCAGPLKGTTFAADVAKLHKGKWDALASSDLVKGTFEASTPAQKKSAAWVLIEVAAEQRLADHAAAQGPHAAGSTD